MAYTISADELKKTLPGYNPTQSEKFHDESQRLADAAYDVALRDREETTVVLTCGGSASGKSEYVSAYLEKRKVIIFDGTLSTLKRAHDKIKKAQAAGKTIEIHAVMPKVFFIAFLVFLNRPRKFPAKHFYRTHSDSRKTLLEVAQIYPKIPITLIMSSSVVRDDKNGMNFEKLSFPSRAELIEFLRKRQYTEEEVRQRARTIGGLP